MAPYVSVADAFYKVGEYVNLVGVIAYNKQPYKCSYPGTDYHSKVWITDNSCIDSGITVSIFYPSEDKHPHVDCIGDIVVVTEVKIQNHDDDTYALFHKDHSSFALFEGIYGQSSTPYHFSLNFFLRRREQEIVANLRSWINNDKLGIELNKTILVSEIKRTEKLDLICEIIHMYETDNHKVILFVWDGTDAPPCNIESLLDNEKGHPLSLQLEDEILPSTIVSKFPTVGSILRVKVEPRRGVLDPTSKSHGSWVKFINLVIDVCDGIWYGTSSPYTRIRDVPHTDCHVVQCLSNSEKRDKWPITSCSMGPTITDTDINGIAIATLMDIINHPEVTAAFRCVVRVVSMLPFNPEKFYNSKGEYRVRLTLEDPTARIHAFLYKKHAETFFGGKLGMHELARKRNMFLGIVASNESEETPGDRNPPWMVCGIFSYYKDKANPWGSRKFEVAMTKLLC